MRGSKDIFEYMGSGAARREIGCSSLRERRGPSCFTAIGEGKRRATRGGMIRGTDFHPARKMVVEGEKS